MSFTWDQVKTSDRKLTVIKNKVYEFSPEFLAWHPGGSVALTQIGIDATGAFEGFHAPSSFLKLKQFQVGELMASEIIPQTSTPQTHIRYSFR